MNITELNSNSVAVMFVVAIFVALITEIIKHFDTQSKLSAQVIQLMTLALGWIGGMIALAVFGGDFANYTLLGLVAGVSSSGIYELVTKTFKLGGN